MLILTITISRCAVRFRRRNFLALLTPLMATFVAEKNHSSQAVDLQNVKTFSFSRWAYICTIYKLILSWELMTYFRQSRWHITVRITSQLCAVIHATVCLHVPIFTCTVECWYRKICKKNLRRGCRSGVTVLYPWNFTGKHVKFSWQVGKNLWKLYGFLSHVSPRGIEIPWSFSHGIPWNLHGKFHVFSP